jgi:hypothetical protein
MLQIKKVKAVDLAASGLPENKQRAIIQRGLKVYKVCTEDDVVKAFCYAQGRNPVGRVTVEFKDTELSIADKSLIVELTLKEAQKHFSFVMHVSSEKYDDITDVTCVYGKDVDNDPSYVYHIG